MGKYFILLILFPLITYGQGGFGVDSNKTIDNGKFRFGNWFTSINDRQQVWSNNHLSTEQAIVHWLKLTYSNYSTELLHMV